MGLANTTYHSAAEMLHEMQHPYFDFDMYVYTIGVLKHGLQILLSSMKAALPAPLHSWSREFVAELLLPEICHSVSNTSTGRSTQPEIPQNPAPDHACPSQNAIRILHSTTGAISHQQFLQLPPQLSQQILSGCQQAQPQVSSSTSSDAYDVLPPTPDEQHSWQQQAVALTPKLAHLLEEWQEATDAVQQQLGVHSNSNSSSSSMQKGTTSNGSWGSGKRASRKASSSSSSSNRVRSAAGASGDEWEHPHAASSSSTAAQLEPLVAELLFEHFSQVRSLAASGEPLLAVMLLCCNIVESGNDCCC
jgi:hypothetical protein